MRKLLYTALCACMLLSFASCDFNEPSNGDDAYNYVQLATRLDGINLEQATALLAGEGYAVALVDTTEGNVMYMKPDQIANFMSLMKQTSLDEEALEKMRNLGATIMLYPERGVQFTLYGPDYEATPALNQWAQWVETNTPAGQYTPMQQAITTDFYVYGFAYIFSSALANEE